MDLAQASPAGPLKPVSGRFRFACHPGMACFTVCCRKLDLVLTPYDILRLKKQLGLEAGQFLEKHTLPADPRRSRWPLVRLRMEDKGQCPFLSAQGCGVYPDRPSACRTYPLARAARPGASPGQVEEGYFLVEEDFCQGFDQDQVWTVQKWVTDQGLVPYHHWNDRWMKILTQPRGPGQGAG
ncbi:MAG: YkgJ family cysteine cluster protein, partial [Deltaproteobacteria bacterium]|nr:YkgJ family cysteine cluster protein [Deltaproteobacteria bacterium]